jgi:hypothetical protein
MRFLLSLLAAGFLLAGCHKYNKRPKHLIPDSTYINLLIELQLLKSYQQEQQPDSVTIDSLRKAIFKKYGTNKNQFRKSHTYYRRNVKQQNKRIKKAIKRLQQDRVIEKDSVAKEDTAGMNGSKKKGK